jgi:hypothetical protein
MDYFVYAENFKDIPSHWEAMENFAKSKQDDQMYYQVFNFIFDDKSSRAPKKIDVNDFRETYFKHCISAYHIIRGVEDNMTVKYPYREKHEDDEPREYYYNSDLDDQQKLPFPLIDNDKPKE